MAVAAVHELVSELAYPMFIVTVAAGGERAGCLVGFASNAREGAFTFRRARCIDPGHQP